MSAGTPVFRTPEEVAPALGMSPTELRRYCRADPANCTRLSNRRIMLDEENIAAVIAYVKRLNTEKARNPETGEIDPFA